MKLGEYLDKDFIFPSLAPTNKKGVLKELIAPINNKFPALDPEQVLDVLMERESLGTTGIGDGIAIPHGKIEALEDVILCVGRCPEGVDFEALDFKPCNIFFLVLAPEQVSGLHLRILAHISRLLKDDHFRDSFLQAEDKDGLWDILKHA